jgi:RND family efflux transporter MFP subunit
MDGFVGKRNIHPGALVAINTPIVNLVDLRTLRMVINVVERDIVRVNKGVTAEVSVDAFPGRTFAGKVLRVSPVMDPATRTGEVEIHVANPGNLLRAEMFARVTLDLGSSRRSIVVPREALVYKGDQSGVFTLEGSVARFRPVEPGLTQQTSVEIVQGLKVGEKVIAMGASLLKDGDQVRLRGEGPPPGRGGRGGGSSPASKM